MWDIEVCIAVITWDVKKGWPISPIMNVFESGLIKGVLVH